MMTRQHSGDTDFYERLSASKIYYYGGQGATIKQTTEKEKDLEIFVFFQKLKFSKISKFPVRSNSSKIGDSLSQRLLVKISDYTPLVVKLVYLLYFSFFFFFSQYKITTVIPIIDCQRLLVKSRAGARGWLVFFVSKMIRLILQNKKDTKWKRVKLRQTELD